MTEQYSQTVEVVIDGKVKRMRTLGVLSFALSLSFIVVAGFVSWYFMFGFGAFFVMGALEFRFFNASPREFIYDFSLKRLVVAKKDVVNRTSRVLTVMFEDVKLFEPLEGMSDPTDIVACGAVCDEGVYQLLFCEGEDTKRLLFAPDGYLVELIKAVLKGSREDKEQA